MSEPRFLGLDIGGANIKYCHANGKSGNVAFELWKKPSELTSAIESLPSWHDATHVAITMTGELADCFETKADGVRSICASADRAAAGKQAVAYYQTDGGFVNSQHALSLWQATAASNWHALASLVGRAVANCVVVDVGSTTTDLIPVRNGNVVAIGSTDLTRLAAGELIYTGVLRSPVCAVVRSVQLNGRVIPVAQELFANMLDVYVITGQIAESKCNDHTADGRPADEEHSFKRLARILCADQTEVTNEQLVTVAEQISDQHHSLIQMGLDEIRQRNGDCEDVVLIGEGAFVVESVLRDGDLTANVFTGDQLLARFEADARPPEVSTAAAVMQLYRQNVHDKVEI